MKYLLPLVCTILLSYNLSAQSRLVKGLVTDATADEPLPGVSILVKNTQSGTTTGVDGSFQIEVPDGSSVLVFSFLGFESQEIAVGNRTSLSIGLIPSTE